MFLALQNDVEYDERNRLNDQEGEEDVLEGVNYRDNYAQTYFA